MVRWRCVALCCGLCGLLYGALYSSLENEQLASSKWVTGTFASEPVVEWRGAVGGLGGEGRGWTGGEGEERQEDISEFISKNRSAVAEFVRRKLSAALAHDRGTGCKLPRLDPYAADAAWYERRLPPLRCGPKDWVHCYHSKCRVVDAILASVDWVECEYFDLLYQDDFHYAWGSPRTVSGAGVYKLAASDFVNVECTAVNTSSGERVKWSGNRVGLRAVPLPRAPAGRELGLSVAILCFDSVPRSGFLRLMPNTWRVLQEELGATVMEGYNVMGDGTAAALFPLLTGRGELELPDVRRNDHNTRTLDDFPFIFRHLSDDGYRTAFLEDMPHDGAFQWRFNGFRRPPADHYMRAFRQAHHRLIKPVENWTFCLGGTPQFQVMMNLAEQFLELDGKQFVFTFIGDISHEDLSTLQWADDAAAAFLRRMLTRKRDTLIVVMSDHGPRYQKVRNTFSLRGKLDERLPLLALRLPDALASARPQARRALRGNSRALVTAHDLHATLLDVVGLRKHWNPYKVEGADLLRGLTLLEPIPRNRSCSEAGIESHWCSCLVWQNVSASDPLFGRAAQALVDYINLLLKDVGSLCAPRSLAAARAVLRQRANDRLLAFRRGVDKDSYVGRFAAKPNITSETFQVGIEAAPGHALYEATLTYRADEDRFLVQARDISRVNVYRGESDCILYTHPHLAPYCYCRG